MAKFVKHSENKYFIKYIVSQSIGYQFILKIRPD